MDCHRSSYAQWKRGGTVKNIKLNSFDLFDKHGVDNCRIILLEAFPCKSKEELTARESFYIQSIKCVNKVIPGRTRAQYREDYRESIIQKHRDYYDMNKDTINKNRRELGSVICECGNSITIRNMEGHIKTQKHKDGINPNICHSQISPAENIELKKEKKQNKRKGNIYLWLWKTVF